MSSLKNAITLWLHLIIILLFRVKIVALQYSHLIMKLKIPSLSNHLIVLPYYNQFHHNNMIGLFLHHHVFLQILLYHIHMKNIEKATNNMKMVYSILCNLKKCTIFELQKLTKFRDVDLCLALGYLLQNNQIYQKRIDNMVYYGVIAKWKDIQ